MRVGRAHIPLLLERRMIRFLNAWKEYRGHIVFKFHACIHLAEQALLKGSPRAYWTHPGEAGNRLMQRVAKSLHGGQTFYVTLLEKGRGLRSMVSGDVLFEH
ncbi:unnamed protein product [Prorocentrum cordatum]|uniref:Uncharacterized protein n=1 Tax=Prorocentrum cordatum TaxID=2364126 RepID=A0ABN9TSS9_9DINO|nr:unnamed protein product [Polarella glacialis]